MSSAADALSKIVEKYCAGTRPALFGCAKASRTTLPECFDVGFGADIGQRAQDGAGNMMIQGAVSEILTAELNDLAAAGKAAATESILVGQGGEQ